MIPETEHKVAVFIDTLIEVLVRIESEAKEDA